MQSYPDFVSWPFDNLILHRTWRRIWSRNPAHEGGGINQINAIGGGEGVSFGVAGTIGFVLLRQVQPQD